jgi:hypothetical protein
MQYGTVPIIGETVNGLRGVRPIANIFDPDFVNQEGTVFPVSPVTGDTIVDTITLAADIMRKHGDKLVGNCITTDVCGGTREIKQYLDAFDSLF